jgi:hypothetical protein
MKFFDFSSIATALEKNWPFHVACRNGRLEEVEALLKVRRKAKVDGK